MSTPPYQTAKAKFVLPLADDETLLHLTLARLTVSEATRLTRVCRAVRSTLASEATRKYLFGDRAALRRVTAATGTGASTLEHLEVGTSALRPMITAVRST
jgi:hypothetical protein